MSTSIWIRISFGEIWVCDEFFPKLDHKNQMLRPGLSGHIHIVIMCSWTILIYVFSNELCVWNWQRLISFKWWMWIVTRKKQQNKSVYIELLDWYAHIHPVSLMQPQQKPTEKEKQMEKKFTTVIQTFRMRLICIFFILSHKKWHKIYHSDNKQ